jgi:hypothetical protein
MRAIPRKTAAMDFNIQGSGAVVLAVALYADCIRPPNAAPTPQIANAVHFTSLMLTPLYRAASGLPPTAYIWRPSVVRSRTNHTIAAMTKAM